jgi:hypothetical protein
MSKGEGRERREEGREDIRWFTQLELGHEGIQHTLNHKSQTLGPGYVTGGAVSEPAGNIQLRLDFQV